MTKKKAQRIKIQVRKCCVCGEDKVVWNASEYAWIFQGKFCCSYTCYRTLEKPYIENYKNKIGIK